MQMSDYFWTFSSWWLLEGNSYFLINEMHDFYSSNCPTFHAFTLQNESGCFVRFVLTLKYTYTNLASREIVTGSHVLFCIWRGKYIERLLSVHPLENGWMDFFFPKSKLIKTFQTLCEELRSFDSLECCVAPHKIKKKKKAALPHGSHRKRATVQSITDKQPWCASPVWKHKVTLVFFFKVSVSERVTGLIKGYWLCAANREAVHRKRKEKKNKKTMQPFVSLSSREVWALAEDQTKGAIDTGTLTLTAAGGEQGLIWANGNRDLLSGATKQLLFKSLFDPLIQLSKMHLSRWKSTVFVRLLVCTSARPQNEAFVTGRAASIPRLSAALFTQWEHLDSICMELWSLTQGCCEWMSGLTPL